MKTKEYKSIDKLFQENLRLKIEYEKYKRYCAELDNLK